MSAKEPPTATTAKAGSGTKKHLHNHPAGCIHLAKLVAVPGIKLDSLILKARERSLAGHTKNVDQKDPKKHSVELGPRYACLQCAEIGSLDFITAHWKKDKHRLSLDVRSGLVYCSPCKEIVHDYTAQQLQMFGTVRPEESRKRKYMAEFDSDPLISNNSSKTPCGREGVRGLFNLGQTCYMNSILQSLLHDPILVSYFLGEGHKASSCEVEDCIGCAVCETFTECRSPDRQDGFAALNLLLASWKRIPELRGYAQQDAHEYYQALIDKLHESTKVYSNNGDCKCFFHKVFFGRLRSTITCDSCGEKGNVDDPFNDLSLHMKIQQAVKKEKKLNNASNGTSATSNTTASAPPTPTLESCLDSYTAKEKLHQFTCKACGTNTTSSASPTSTKSATKQLKIRQLPLILCMQMKRFDHTTKSSESTKIEGKVDFPLSLDMSPYTIKSPTSENGPDSFTATNGTSVTPTPLSAALARKQRYTYDLTSVIVHKGSLDSGHYFVYCREPRNVNSLAAFAAAAATATNNNSTATTTTDTNLTDPSSVTVAPALATSTPSTTTTTTTSTTTTTTNNPSLSTAPTNTAIEDNWYLFNDDRVTLAPVQEVLSADAYLLFYGLRWLPGGGEGRGERVWIRQKVDEVSSDED